MAIPDADPRAQDLDAAFAAAMDAPARPRAEAKPPPEVDHDAPHGRDEAGEPLAPFGLTKDGKPKRTPGGRPRKDAPDAPRTGTVTPARPESGGKAGKAKPDPRDWTEELSGLADAAWFGLSALGKVSGSVPVLGKLLPGAKVQAQAFILSETKPQLVGAVNLAAQHSASAARFCARLEDGDGLWALSAMFMVMPVLSMSVAVWKGEAIDTADGGKVAADDMAALNGAKMDEAVARIQAQIAAQAQAAQASVAGAAEPQPAA